MGIAIILSIYYIRICNNLPLVIQQGNLGGNCFCSVGKPNMYRIHTRSDKIIPQAICRTLQQVYVPENTAGAELILIFQIASVTPLQHKNGQPVCSSLQCMGNIKLRGRMRNLTIADIPSVDPNVEAGIDTLKIQIDFGRVLIRNILKIPQVCAAGIFVRNIRRVCRERIVDVGVLMLIVPVILPDTGHRNGCPVLRIKACFKKALSEIMDTFTIHKLPLAVQKLKTIRVFTMFHQVIHGTRRRNIIRAIGFCTLMESVNIFKVGRYHHLTCSPVELVTAPT